MKVVLLIRCRVDTVIHPWAKGVLVNKIGEPRDVPMLYVMPVMFYSLLPPYSPQLNPIEHKWAQAQAIRKQKHGSISDILTLYEI
jgi:hypothetical protein